ncbi:MAG TPA: hypothetical protein VER17_01240 [Tepidisphaeraceae bacterium]|nr:hypothetical protein [Tepidisphaeraceae bacterium]
MNSPAQDPTAPGVNPSASAGGTGYGGRLGADAVTDDQAPGQAFKSVSNRLSELSEYISYFISAKTDGIKLTLRNVAIFAALGLVGLIAGGAMVVTAVVMVCVGIATGLGRLFNYHYWAGSLLTGLLLLGLVAGGIYFGLKTIGKSSRTATVKKYAARQQQQRAKYGQDVRQRASDPAE